MKPSAVESVLELRDEVRRQLARELAGALAEPAHEPRVRDLLADTAKRGLTVHRKVRKAVETEDREPQRLMAEIVAAAGEALPATTRRAR